MNADLGSDPRTAETVMWADLGILYGNIISEFPNIFTARSLTAGLIQAEGVLRIEKQTYVRLTCLFMVPIVHSSIGHLNIHRNYI